MDVSDQEYTGIFQNITPGRLSFRVANINKHSFSLTQEQIIDEFNGEIIQTHVGAYAIHIRNIFYYDKIQLCFLSYLYPINSMYTNYLRGIDIVIKDGNGLRYDITLKEFVNRNYDLSFAKIISNLLFFAFSDNQEVLYMMELDSGKYEVKQYNHPVGMIQNIWLKAQGDAEYIFTSEKDKTIISGIFKIIEQDGLELMEIYDYKVVGYNSLNGSSFYYNRNNILLYRRINNSTDYIIKEFIGKGETIYDVFFLEDDSFIIGSTRIGPDHFGNLLFGSGHLIYYFYYYHLRQNEQGNLVIKKIKTFGSLWKLEHLIYKGNALECHSYNLLYYRGE